MALGTLGSTLNDELNRLANGGTYRDMNQMVDEALAAKQWANRENINPYSTDTVGILNEIAGLGLDKKNWLDFNGVCNYIAGTTGLPAAAALRQVYPTTDLLTGVASYYVDAAYPTGLTSTPGYVYLNGAAGNFMSTPDSSALDVTGDIDLRAYIALDDWTPAADNTIFSKWTTNNISYALNVNTTGALGLYYSLNGTAITGAVSTVATGFADGSLQWIRVTRASASGQVIFYTSTDGSTWTQLGTTISSATGSIFSGTAPLDIGRLGTGSNMTSGKIYRVQVLNGIGGTVAFDANMANVPLTATSFTESSSNAATVTINGFRAYPQTADNLGTAGSLLPTTLGSSTAADSNDPKFLDFTGTNYVYLPGVASNRLDIPDADALDITGDIDLRAFVALDDWTPAGTTNLVGKWQGGSNRSYTLRIEPAGTVTFAWSADGTAALSATSTVATGVADGAAKWIRATLDVDNGTSGRDIRFFTSDNGTSWTQLGTTVTQAGVTSIFNSTINVSIGNEAGVNMLAGKVFRAQILNGIGGTTVLDVNTSVITAGSATSFTAVTGQTVTINRSTSGRKTVAVTQPTWLFGTDDYMEVNNRYMSSGTYLYLPGVASNFASAPDAAPLDITGDIDLRVKVALDDYTPSASNTLIAKWNSAGNNLSYLFRIGTDAKLILNISSDGSTSLGGSRFSTAVVPFTDGQTGWLRATFASATGNVDFYTSTDGTNWTQLGTTVAGTSGSIFSGTAELRVGAGNGGNEPARGKFFRAQVLNGINGTVAFDANFETSITSLLQTSFTESSANAATVTINRSGSAYRSAGITAAGYLYPGATNTFAASATDFLNFGASDSFTVFAVWRQWDTTPTKVIISSSGSIGGGYFIYQHTLNRAYFQITDTVQFPSTFLNVPVGSLAAVSGVRNVTLDRLEGYLGTANPVTTTDTTTGTLRNFGTLRIGAQFNGVNADAEIYAAAVFRQALTASQIRQISNYFANREVYL